MIRPSPRSDASSAQRARQPITALTLAGGFASTVSWPATYLLHPVGRLARHLSGLRGAARVGGGAAACLRAAAHRAPTLRGARTASRECRASRCRRTGWPFILVAAAFAAYAFVPSGLSAHLLAIFGRAGIDAGHRGGDRRAVRSGAGRRRVSASSCSRATSIRSTWRASRSACCSLAFVLLALFGISVAVAVAFAMMFGMANGLITIARGAVPLALFGAAGYGHLMGRIAGTVPGDAGHRAARARLRGRADVRPGRARGGRGLRAAVVHRAGGDPTASE